MNPLTAAAIAVSTVVTINTLEKTGENIEEVLKNKTSAFLSSLKQASPEAVSDLEKVPDQFFDYDRVIVEVESAAINNDQVAQTLEDLVTVFQNNPSEKVLEIINEVVESLKKHPHDQVKVASFSKLADSLKNLCLKK